MYSSTAGTLSVKGSMDNISFSSYLRGRMNNHHNLLCYPFRAEPPQPLAGQTTNNSQGVFAASFPPSQKPASFQSLYGRPPLFYSSINMTTEAQGYFKDHIRHPDEVYLSSSFPATIPPFHHDGAPFASSWSAGQSNYTSAPATSQVPMKIDNSPALPVPGILPSNVDTSKYESLSYDEWSNASVDYDSSTSSSSPYYASSPATPGDTYQEYWLSPPLPLSHSSYAESSAFRFRPQSMTDTTNLTGATSTSLPYVGAYNMPSGLPSSHNTLDNPLHGYPAYPQFHHQGMIEPSLPPPDLDAQTPSESDHDSDTDVDDDEALSSTSAPQAHNYTFSDDDIDTRSRRDERLLNMRREKYSYREIKDICGFKEAESTLRGRYRALTKDKEERVRRPQWQPKDVALLRRFVKYYSNTTKARMRCGRRKLPWKKISQRMKDHGGSYLFAPATCAKKWESLQK